MSSNLKVNTILPSTGTTVTVSGISSVTSSISAGSSITGTTFYGSGANLTSLPSQITFNNASADRVLTSNGGTAVNAEANLTMTGNNLQFNTTANGHAVILKSTGNYYNKLSFDSGNTSAGGELAYIDFKWDGDKVADIQVLAGSDTTNKDDGHLVFRTSPSQGSIAERIRINSNGSIQVTPEGSTSNPYMLIDTSGDSVRFNAQKASGNNEFRFLTQSSGTVAERLRIDSSGRVVVGGTGAYIGGAALAVLGTGTTPNTYGSFAIGKIGANPTANTTLANIRLNGGSLGTRRGAEINAIANSNWTDGSSHPTKLTFAVANVNSASATQRFEINHYGHMVFTNENALPGSGSAGTNSFKGLSQHGYQHWGQRQYYSGQVDLTQNQYFDLISNNSAYDDIIFWFNIKGFHGNRTFATAHGAIGGYGLDYSTESASGVYGSFSLANITTGRNMLRWTSTTPNSANWWIWGWYSGTNGTGTHTGWSAAQLH